MISRLSSVITLLALMCMGMTLREAHSALLISGPATGAPGDELTPVSYTHLTLPTIYSV